jgi:hypothetical protein
MPCNREKKNQACFTLFLASALTGLGVLMLDQLPANCQTTDNDATKTYCGWFSAISVGLFALAGACALSNVVTTHRRANPLHHKIYEAMETGTASEKDATATVVFQ